MVVYCDHNFMSRNAKFANGNPRINFAKSFKEGSIYRKSELYQSKR